MTTWIRDAGLNETIKSTSVSWSSGGTADRVVAFPLDYSRPVMFSLNGNTTEALTVLVGLQYQVNSTWLAAKTTDGAALTFPVTTAASTAHQGVFGPFTYYARFDAARLTFATTKASTDASIKVQVRAV